MTRQEKLELAENLAKEKKFGEIISMMPKTNYIRNMFWGIIFRQFNINFVYKDKNTIYLTNKDKFFIKTKDGIIQPHLIVTLYEIENDYMRIINRFLDGWKYYESIEIK